MRVIQQKQVCRAERRLVSQIHKTRGDYRVVFKNDCPLDTAPDDFVIN